MIRRKIDAYLRNYYAHTRSALLVTGARQTGKTFSIREFGKTFKSFIEINFVENPDAVEIFKGAKSAADILLRISAMTATPLVKGRTLIFFDEVQRCPDIVTAIKFLVDEGSYRYILSGSLLGVELRDLRSEPVGYMGVKEMYPLDFEEFITCVGIDGQVVAALRSAWEHRSPVDAFVHRKIMELFRLYLVVGGMPAVVSKYMENNNLQEVMTIQQDIIRLYKRDIAQYDLKDKLYLEEIFELIPPELNAKNKRFILKRLNENAKFDRCETGFAAVEFRIFIQPFQNEAFVFRIEFRRDKLEYLLEIEFIFQIILGNIALVQPDNILLYRHDFLQIIVFHILAYHRRHTAHHQIEAEQFHDFSVDERIDRRAMLPRRAQRGDDLSVDANTSNKLLEIERIHLLDAHIPYRLGTQVAQLHSQQRTAQNVSVRAFIDQKFNGGYYIRTPLHLVEKNQCPTFDKRRRRHCRNAEQNIGSTLCPLEYFHRIGILHKIDFDKTFERLAKFPNRKCLAGLSGAGNQQGTARVRVIIPEIGIYFSSNHNLFIFDLQRNNYFLAVFP